MAKPAQFQAYDLHRSKKQHKIPSPPTKISESKLLASAWKVSKRGSKKPAKKGRGKKSAADVKAPKRAIDLLRCKGGDFICLQCGSFSDDPSCGIACYKRFRRENLSANLIDIRGPGLLGYGAFTRPNITIPKGAYIGEYLGELLPLSAAPTSTYRFEIPSVCTVDAQSSGNWTRFINSHCRPNVKPWGDTVGKRHVILFQAVREIGPEEEIVFDYGARFFEKAGFMCGCDVQKGLHLPKGAKGKGRKK